MVFLFLSKPKRSLADKSLTDKLIFGNVSSKIEKHFGQNYKRADRKHTRYNYSSSESESMSSYVIATDWFIETELD